jgi:universal stress protein A
MAAYKKILVLLDLNEGSERIALAARDMASQSNAELVILHVVEFVPSEPAGETLMPAVEIEEDLARRARAKLNDLSARLGLARTSVRVEGGNPKGEILRVAEEEAVDLIVLGSRLRHGLGALVNYPEDTVLHAARCDVLAIRI